MLLPDSKITDSKVLIVDDNLQNVLILKEILADFGQIYFAESGADALELITKISPDLILLDIEMPEMDGWQVCKTLKHDSRFAGIPVIFITGHNQPEFEEVSLELGGADFITKPFNPAICRLRVGNQLKLSVQTRLISKGREQLQKLVKQVPVLITYWDSNWNNLFSNDYSGSWFGIVNRNNARFTLTEAFPQELSKSIQAHVVADDSEQQFIVETNVEGKTRFYQVFQSVLLVDNILDGHLVTLVDISEVKLAKKSLYSEKERLRVTLNSIGDAVVATDIEGNITFMNPIAERMTGWRFRDALNLKIERVMPLQEANSKQPLKNPIYIALREQRTVAMALNSELKNRHGATYAVEDSAAPIRDEAGKLIGGIMVFHDVSETMAMSIKMSHLANHDQLTDLPNRILLQDRLTVACDSANANKLKVCVLLLDLDHFKYLNDSLGHQYGDELICQMAKRLKALIPQSYTLSRLGGDEFVILMNDLSSADSASLMAGRLLNAMHEQFNLANQFYNVSVSMGISIYPDDAQNAEQLMRHADVAMYRAKQEGRNRYCFFSDELEQALIQRQELERLLREALKRDELIVHYQPKFDFQTGKIVGAEALVRLQDDNGLLISPAQFIPLAEESGLVIELGIQVLFKACAAAKHLLDQGIEVPMSVNVAAAQFGSDELELHIKNALAINALPAHLLELEITETALMVDAQATQTKLEQLKTLGIKISIDDFGTGYSSLSYLKRFNVDIMKIDMSFVRDMMDNKHDYEIVRTIISLGQSMGLKIVAEGVEIEVQKEALNKLGCEIGQGYLYSKPLDAEQFFAFAQR
ncbi:EAL domain-containing protein [Paraglaciecola sp.]|uniref:two-component system response regulator n=1 Tax=Paraglaciecola sp. TaxID=1920173 RepID=UPI0030F3C7B4